MAESEILDQVDKDGNIIGQARRSVFHSDPTKIHAVVHCWLLNSKGEILWQQRSLQKATSPGAWDMSCGGHILSGQKPEETLRRELEEELGLVDVNFNLVEKYVLTHKTQTELIYLYYGIIDTLTTEMKLQKEEVEQVEWIDPSIAQTLALSGERECTDFVFTQITKILRHLAFKNERKLNVKYPEL